MKIAVTYEHGEIFQHFGHTERFKLCTVEYGKIARTRTIGTDGSDLGGLGDAGSRYILQPELEMKF